MTDPQVALLMLGIFIFIILLGFPIAFTLMAMGIGFGYYAYFDAERMWRAFDRAAAQVPTADAVPDLDRGVVQQPHLRSVHKPDLFGDGERRADGGAAVPVHGLRRRARQHRQPPVLYPEHRREAHPRLDGGGGADHLRALRHRHRHRRRRGHADGPAGLSGHAEGPLRQQLRLRRHLRRRHAWHPDPAIDHADRLCRGIGRLDRPALCWRPAAGLHAGRALSRLHRRPGLAATPMAPKPRDDEIEDIRPGS